MSKRSLIAIIIAAFLLIGGIIGVRQYLAYQSYQTYLRSSDKVADDFVSYLTANNPKKAYNDLFSTNFRDNYPESYWEKNVFPLFSGYQGSKRLHSKGAVKSTDPSMPSRYDPHLNQQATQYEYDFTINDLTYRVTFVVILQNGQWKISELNGAYSV